jgi:hypothetical protein
MLWISSRGKESKTENWKQLPQETMIPKYNGEKEIKILERSLNIGLDVDMIMDYLKLSSCSLYRKVNFIKF